MEDENMAVVNNANILREKFKELEIDLRNYVSFVKQIKDENLFDKGECIAHSMLSLRHCEDARMRLGKVIQYSADGTSSFDKK